MSQARPDFFDSPFFYIDDDGWHLKEGAPEEVVREFKEYMYEPTERMIESFRFENSFFLAFNRNRTVVIESQGDVYTLSFSMGFGVESEPLVLSEEDSNAVDEFIGALNIPKWKSEYDNPNILDGEQWSVQVVFADGSRYKSTGSNAYPSAWRKLSAFINHWAEDKYMELEIKK